MNRNLMILASLVCAAAFGTASAQAAQTPDDLCSAVRPAEPETRTFAAPEQVVQPDIDYRAVMCTSAGAIYIDLFEDYTPLTVNNFVFLAQQGYYNNTTFHRVIADFMAQGGDPTGTGTGGPGYQFADEFVGFLTFDQSGFLAMANAGPGTNGSQFFITTVPTPHLDFAHTIFGEVLSGQEAVAAIELRDPATATTSGTTLNTVLIIDDPATIAYDAPPAGEPATAADVAAAFAQLDDLLPPDGVTHSVTQATTDELASADAATAEFLDRYTHQFRVTDALESCDLANVPFMQTRYTLDAFATPDEAAAALAQPFLAEQLSAAGYAVSEAPDIVLPNPVYTRETSACDQPAVNGVTHWLRGRYLITVEVTVPTDSPAPVEAWLSEVVGVRLYEPLLASILRRELRGG